MVSTIRLINSYCFLWLEHLRSMPFAMTWLNLESIMPSKISHKEGYMTYDVTYMYNLKK